MNDNLFPIHLYPVEQIRQGCPVLFGNIGLGRTFIQHGNNLFPVLIQLALSRPFGSAKDNACGFPCPYSHLNSKSAIRWSQSGRMVSLGDLSDRLGDGLLSHSHPSKR
jgi:hypothetical protein